MRHRLYPSLLVFLLIEAILPSKGFPQTEGAALPASAPAKLTLVQSVMCENIKEYTPQNPAVVFSISIGEVSCFTYFDPVPETTFIYHKWFHRDRLTTERKLYLKPARWATFSSIQLREADKGPWRVEVSDKDDNILKVLRFSITE
jgi:hypothetical protein